MTLESHLMASRQANIERHQSQHHTNPIISTFSLMTRCHTDEQAIIQCFEAVPGDPLDNMKGWRNKQ